MTYKSYFREKMSVAIILSGSCDKYFDCLSSIKKHVYDPLKNAGYNFDIFFSTWKSESVSLENLGNTLTEFEYEKIESKNKFSQRFGPELGPIISLWYKTYKVFSICLDKRKYYSHIIRVFPGKMYTNDFSAKNLKLTRKNTIYESDCVYGDFDSMSEYCRTYESISRYLNLKTVPLTERGFLQGRLSDRNITLVKRQHSQSTQPNTL